MNRMCQTIRIDIKRAREKWIRSWLGRIAVIQRVCDYRNIHMVSRHVSEWAELNLR